MGYVTKDVGYNELSLEEYVAGYSAILLLPQVSLRERLHRTEHLGALMYLASIYEWLAVRSFHAAVSMGIEQGRLHWGDSFLHLENRMLAGSHKKVKDQNKRPAPQTSTVVLFCRKYQKNSYAHNRDHYTMLRGEKKWLCHICAACWVKNKAIPSILLTAPINLNLRSDYLALLSSHLYRTLTQLISHNFVLRTFMI